MMFLRVGLMTVLTYWSLIAETKTEAFSEKILNLLSLCNGYYNNIEDINSCTANNKFVEKKLMPVDIPALRPMSVVFLEHSINKVIDIVELLVMSKDSQQNIIITRYNFTDGSRYRSGNVKPSDLTDITLNDLRGDKSCVGEYKETSPGTFMGTWPECRYIKDGKHPTFVVTITCNSLTVFIPENISGVSRTVPLLLKLRDRYPPRVIVPDNYVSICDKVYQDKNEL